jgi:hypothetical protein
METCKTIYSIIKPMSIVYVLYVPAHISIVFHLSSCCSIASSLLSSIMRTIRTCVRAATLPAAMAPISSIPSLRTIRPTAAITVVRPLSTVTPTPAVAARAPRPNPSPISFIEAAKREGSVASLIGPFLYTAGFDSCLKGITHTILLYKFIEMCHLFKYVKC